MKPMKKIIKYKITFLFALIFALTSCEDDQDFNGDDRLEGTSESYIYHVNPKTGLDYTREELNELDYDPALYESYKAIGQPIELAVVTELKPLRIDVISGTDKSILGTINEFSSREDGTFISSYFASEISSLGLVEFESMVIEFRITYDNANVNGQSNSSVEVISIVIQNLEGRAPSIPGNNFVYLKKKGESPIGLSTADIITERIRNPFVGSILTFDGADDQVEVNSSKLDFRKTGNFSVGIWVNTTATNSDPSIIGDKDWNGGANKGFVFAYLGGAWKLNIGDGANRADLNGTAINDGNWHFLMATIDRAGDVTIYQDGVAKGSADISPINGADMGSGMPIRIGQDGTGTYSQYYNGMVGDTYIYNYALSAEEAAMEAAQYSGAELRTQAGVSRNLSVTNSGGIETSENGKFTFEFDGTNHATVDDTSDLDFTNSGDFTVSTWVNTSATNSDPSFLSNKDWNGGSNKGFVFAFLGSNWRLNAGDGSNRIDINGDVMNDGEWHLLTVTFDRDGMCTIYQDSEYFTSTDMSAIGDMDSGLPIRIGQDGTGTYGSKFTGKVANTIIFDYVLTPEEIANLF